MEFPMRLLLVSRIVLIAIVFEISSNARARGPTAFIVQDFGEYLLRVDTDGLQTVIARTGSVAGGNFSSVHGIALDEGSVLIVSSQIYVKAGDLRLAGLYALLGAKQQRTLGDVLQDTQCESEAGDPVCLPMVSSPPPPLGERSARGAHEAHSGALQLLWCERQL